MTRVLVMSSWVAAGHVGLSAAAPALHLLGHSVIALPTVMLSNHRGWPSVAGDDVPPSRILGMLDAIAANGWLAGVDAVLTGYLPTPDTVDAACAVVRRARAANPAVRVVCDPVLGDDPGGLYLPAETAAALRDRLAPLADTLTPNRFELSLLTGEKADDLAGATAAASRLAARLRRVVVTSPPLGPEETGVLDVAAGAHRLHRVARRAGVPKGVGDVFSALVAAGCDPGRALGRLDALIGLSLGAPELRIAEGGRAWTEAARVPYENLATRELRADGVRLHPDVDGAGSDHRGRPGAA